MQIAETDTHSSPLDLVSMIDFIDAGIRCELTANQTISQLLNMGFVVETGAFYDEWRNRRQLWRLRNAA